MEFNMVFNKRASIATTLMLGTALGVPLSITAFSDPAPSSNAVQRQPTASLQHGDLVRLRSGGPLMTVESVKGNQVDCFWTGMDGQPNAESFPIDVVQKF
jgi:uncharacterized protein YodC (DUF2158 family)